jgi:hypothetical protein
MSNAKLKCELALADLIRDLAHAQEAREKQFAAIVRVVRHREAKGPAKDMMKQIRSDKQLCKMLVDYEVRNHRHDGICARLKNEAAPAHVASRRTVICCFVRPDNRRQGMIDVDATKYNRKKAAVNSIYKRLLPPQRTSTQGTAREPGADAVASEFDARKGGAELVPHSAAGNDGAPSPKDVAVPGADGGAERAGDFSQGKILDPRDREVTNYIDHIGASWRRGVQGLMEVALLCAEANARLKAAQKSELIARLPFRQATFSKFAQIGADTRLNAAEIQRLLPPCYTTMYEVTLLKDEELSLAIAEKVLHPDMNRSQLQRWRKSRELRHLPSAKDAATGSTTGMPITPTHAVESGALPSTVSGDDNRDNQEQLALAPEDAPPEAAATAVEVAGPLTPPPGDDDIPAFLDRRPLSAEDQRVFDMIMAAWSIASLIVRERVSEIIRAAVVRRKSRKNKKQPDTFENTPF